MPPILIARPGVEPVSLAEAKAHLRLEGSDEDALVAGLVSAARAFVQGTTRLCLIAQTWRIAAPGWPPGRAIALPVAPVLAVGAVRIGTAGGPVLLPETAWSLDEGADPARIVAADDAPDPTGPGGIEIDVTAGFGTEPADVPEPLRLATLMLVASWFEARGDDTAPGVAAVPPAARELLALFTRRRLA